VPDINAGPSGRQVEMVGIAARSPSTHNSRSTVRFDMKAELPLPDWALMSVNFDWQTLFN
jgi:hypothetical protein